MAINVSQSFHRTSANPVDDTLTLTKAQMLTVNDNLMPAKYLTICQDDGFIYLYDKSATPNGTTGKFTKFEGGLELGETSSTAYRGDRGKTAYDDSQTNKTSIGTLSSLKTTAKNNLVSAINEVHDSIVSSDSVIDGYADFMPGGTVADTEDFAYRINLMQSDFQISHTGTNYEKAAYIFITDGTRYSYGVSDVPIKVKVNYAHQSTSSCYLNVVAQNPTGSSIYYADYRTTVWATNLDTSVTPPRATMSNYQNVYISSYSQCSGALTPGAVKVFYSGEVVIEEGTAPGTTYTLVRGEHGDLAFFKDAQLTEMVTPSADTLYYDIPSKDIYHWDSTDGYYTVVSEMQEGDVADVLTPIPNSHPKRIRYSYDEQVIGEWVNKKPLYQKTVCVKMPVVATDLVGTIVSYPLVDLGINDFDIGWVYDGYVTVNDIPTGSVNFTWSNNGTDLYYVQASFNGYSGGLLTLGANRGNLSEQNAYVTIRYTKTTD